jgi:ParB/RepB/Spo0J family partition protein
MTDPRILQPTAAWGGTASTRTIRPSTALHIATAIGHAVAIADRMSIELIASEGVKSGQPPGWAEMGWLDVGVLFNEQEYGAVSIDQHRQVVDYAVLRGLVLQHPAHPQPPAPAAHRMTLEPHTMNALAEPIDIAALPRSAIDGAQWVPVNLVQASPTNPRKRFVERDLADLADSIKKHGVLEPVRMRPREGARKGEPLYELIFGERRWRACKIAGEEFIAAIVQPMSDHEVREVQLVENLQREDLGALEEADGYAELLRTGKNLMGLTVEQLCTRIGKSRSHVFQRLKLRELGPAGRMALDAGEISPSVALLVARLGTEDDQATAVKEILRGWGGEPMSFRSAQEYIQRTFMLDLSRAPFKITDATLVPAAGSCRECPKRTGAAPDLFDDVKNGDTCTDAACFHGKEEAHRARLKAQAEADGVKVITGAEAKKAVPSQFGSLKGYLELDKVHHLLGNKPLAKLLGKDGPEVMALENPHTHELVRVVREADAVKALRDKGVIKTSRMPTTSKAVREAELRRTAENNFRHQVAQVLAMRARTEPGAQPEFRTTLISHVAVALYGGLGSDERQRVDKLMGWDAIEQTYHAENRARRDARVAALADGDLALLLCACCVAGELKVGTYQIANTGKAPESRHLLPLATALGVDVDFIRADLKAQVKAELKAKAQTPAKALAKAVKTTKPTTTPPQISAAAADPFREA